MPLSKEQMKIYRQKNKDKIKKKAEAWKAENKDKVLASKKLWRETHKEYDKQYHAQKWQQNKERYYETSKTWIKNNQEKYKKKRQRIKARKQYGAFWEAQITKLELIKCLKTINPTQ